MIEKFARILATVAISTCVWFGAQSCSFVSSSEEGAVSGSIVPVAVGTATVAPPTRSTAARSPSQIQASTADDFSYTIRRVAEQVRPAVVQITTHDLSSDLLNDSGDTAGVGSGVIYDPAGYILTNNHVVAGAKSLAVALPDGRTFDGKLLGGDSQTDLAVVQIQGENLPVALLGDSDQLSVGDWVVAIGNALGLPGGPTVTVGVVSALGRTVQEPGDGLGEGGPFLYDLIQTDASINPGNSGGALVNLKGEVVGINTLVAGAAGPGILAQGIGFAIAVNGAKPVVDQLIATGHVAHPFLGIRYVGITPVIARDMGIQDTQGIVVIKVVPGSPADLAGVRQLDVIKSIDGQSIEHESVLGRELSAHKPGDVVSLEIIRNGVSGQLRVTLGEAPRN